MAGNAITVTEMAPNIGLKMIYFTGTPDGSKDLDFSAYPTIYLVKLWAAANPGATANATTTVTSGGDVRFTNAVASIGYAIVQD